MKLIWNEEGRIGCEKPGHAPHRGSDSWVFGRWRAITTNERIDFEAEIGRPPTCEACDAEKRKAVAS